jgi:hypothetical protein
MRLPPLVTTSPQGTAQANAGVLGQPGTSVLFGASNVNDDARFGLRFGAGWWFDCDRCFGIEAGFMWLDGDSTGFAASSSGNPILARPFFNALTNKNDSQLVAFQGTVSGGVTADASAGSLYEMHFDIAGNISNCSWCRLDALLGYRYFSYDENLRVSSTISPAIQPGAQIGTLDQFRTENEFNGIDFGLRAEFCWHSLTFDLLAKGAVGNVQREVDIDGSTRTSVAGSTPVTTNSGGLLALSSNIGNHKSNDWTIMPEFGGTVSWQPWTHVKLYVGYDFMMLTQVARAADQVSLQLNPNLIPPPTGSSIPNVPAFNLNRGDVIVQTVYFGLELRF